jgi:lysophospholipase L1-like esterase
VKRAVVVLALVAATCTSTPEDSVSTTTDQLGTSARFLALGDSYTIGESVETDDRWPNLLGRNLEDSGYSFVDVQIVARTGWTTSELDAAIDGADPIGPFDLVTLLIGVNNQFRGLDSDEYRDEFGTLLDRAVGLAGDDPTRVVVVSIPDWGVTPFGSAYESIRIAEEIDRFNEIGRLGAEAAGAHWVDITPISRGDAPDLEADDGLHPSGEQYRLWVQEILPIALEAMAG